MTGRCGSNERRPPWSVGVCKLVSSGAFCRVQREGAAAECNDGNCGGHADRVDQFLKTMKKAFCLGGKHCQLIFPTLQLQVTRKKKCYEHKDKLVLTRLL